MTVRGSVEDVEKTVKLLTVLGDEVESESLNRKVLIGNAGANIPQLSDEIAERAISGVEDGDRETMSIGGEKDNLFKISIMFLF